MNIGICINCSYYIGNFCMIAEKLVKETNSCEDFDDKKHWEDNPVEE